MILYDISKNTLTAKPYAGDRDTEFKFVKSMKNGDRYNLSEIAMSPHTGTHIDAPFHFDEEGAAIDDLRISTFWGKCTVITIEGILTWADK